MFPVILTTAVISNIINLQFVIGEWSECIDNVQTRDIRIKDNLNNTYTYDQQQLNKDYILLTLVACNERTASSIENTIVMIIVILLVILAGCCWIGKYFGNVNHKPSNKVHPGRSVNSILYRGSYPAEYTAPVAATIDGK